MLRGEYKINSMFCLWLSLSAQQCFALCLGKADAWCMMCTCGCKNAMCLCIDLHVVPEVKCAQHLCFAYTHSSLAAQNNMRQGLSIVQEDGCELFLLFGCCFCSIWSWLAAVLGVWSPDQSLVLKQLELCCRGHVSLSHMHIFLPSCIRTKFGSLYADRCIYWTQDVSVDLFVCTSRRKWRGSWTHQIV